MPSTHTTRNRLEKQGTGENSNTWGTRLNEKTFDLIDTALDGLVAFTLSGTKTLTSTNAADDEARNRCLHITGGTGGTITIPSVEKLYFVVNQSTGSVIVTTGSGTTATVPTGVSTWVVCDVSSVYQDNTLNEALAALADADEDAAAAAASALAALASETAAALSASAAAVSKTAAEAAAVVAQSAADIITTLYFVFDGGSVALVSGRKIDLPVPFSGTIQSWTITGDASGSAVITVSKATYANFPTFTAISGTEKPTLSAAQKGQDTSLTTWTTTITGGDVLRANLDSVSSLMRITVALKVLKG